MSHLYTARGPRNRVTHQKPAWAFPQPSCNDWNEKFGLGKKFEIWGANDDTRDACGSSTSSDSGSDTSSMFHVSQRSTPSTTPSLTPSKDPLNLPADEALAAKNMKAISSEIGTAMHNFSNPILSSAEETPVSESTAVIKAHFIGPLSIEQNITSFEDRIEHRKNMKDISRSRSNNTSTRSYTARGYWIAAGLTRHQHAHALYCIHLESWENGEFVTYPTSLDTASPCTILYKKKWKNSQPVLDTVGYNDGFDADIAATNEHVLKFPLYSDCVNNRRNGAIDLGVQISVEVAETGTQDTNVFTKSGAERPHGTLGLAPANKISYKFPLKEVQTILKRWWSRNFADMRGQSKELFGFITLHLRQHGGFVRFGNPSETVIWIKTEQTRDWAPSSWSLMVHFEISTPSTQTLCWPPVPILFDCAQSVSSGPDIFVDQIYKFLGIKYRTVKSKSRKGREKVDICYIDAQGSMRDDVQITLSHTVKLTLPSRFWNEGPTKVLADDGQLWRFGPLQIDPAGITFGANAWEFMDVHLKSNFDEDEHYIGLTQHRDDLA